MTTTRRARPPRPTPGSSPARALAYARRVLRYRGLAALGALPGVGERAYTRFVVVGRGRSGTNFVRGLLDSHPGVIAHGELFRDFDAPQRGAPRLLQSRSAWRRKRDDPVEFVERSVFRRFPPTVGAVGFKLFEDHAREDPWGSVWSWATGDDRLQAIHVVRRDRLATLVSLRLAEATGGWVNAPADGTLTLSPAECASFFAESDAADARLRETFPGHRRLEVVYEELMARPAPALERLQRFLGVPVRPLVPGTVRQSRRPPSEVVVNHASLREHFSGSRWSTFFD